MDENLDKYEARLIKTPDGVNNIISLPKGHWLTLDWLTQEKFTDINERMDIAWKVWHIDKKAYPLYHVLGFTIQEAFVQYETFTNGFCNDNKN